MKTKVEKKEKSINFERVMAKDLKVGDVVFDLHPTDLGSIKFEVVSIVIKDDAMYLKPLSINGFYHKEPDGTVPFSYLEGGKWYKLINKKNGK